MYTPVHIVLSIPIISTLNAYFDRKSTKHQHVILAFASFLRRRSCPCHYCRSHVGLFCLQYVHALGVSEKWQFTDVWGLEPELLMMVPTPVIAVVLLYPIKKVFVQLYNQLGRFYILYIYTFSLLFWFRYIC